MTGLERAAVAAMVGASGALVMGAILWREGVPDLPLVLFAFAGAALAGAGLAGRFGRRWPVAVLASVTATVFGAAAGAFLVHPSAEALLIGPYFVVASLLNAPVALVVWAASQMATHLIARRFCRRNPWLADPAR